MVDSRGTLICAKRQGRGEINVVTCIPDLERLYIVIIVTCEPQTVSRKVETVKTAVARGYVKLIDFGIAKRLDEDMEVARCFTASFNTTQHRKQFSCEKYCKSYIHQDLPFWPSF